MPASRGHFLCLPLLLGIALHVAYQREENEGNAAPRRVLFLVDLSGKNPKGQPVQNHWAVSVSGNWRLTFYFEGKDAVLVDYQDYH